MIKFLIKNLKKKTIRMASAVTSISVDHSDLQLSLHFGFWEFPFPLQAQLSISRDAYFYPAFVGILYKEIFLKCNSLSL